MNVHQFLHDFVYIDWVVSACNFVLSNSYCTNELIQLQLQESYCLPILTYAFPGLRVHASQIRELNVCWNSVYRKIFHYNRWESVKCCINGLGRMDLVHILAFQALKFWKSLMQSTNRTVTPSCVLGKNVTIWFYCERTIVLQLRVLVYWRVKFLSIIPVFVLHVRLRVDWVCLLYGHITVCTLWTIKKGGSTFVIITLENLDGF